MNHVTHFICVTSVINITTNALSYSNVRSVFSHEQRLIATTHTLQSIQQHFRGSNVFVLVVDGSLQPLSDGQKLLLLTNGAHAVISVDHPDIHGLHKGLGEVRILQAALAYTELQEISFDTFWKLSGRAWITEQFDLKNWPALSSGRFPCDDSMSTILFKVANSQLNEFKQLLEDCQAELKQGKGIEKCFATSGFFAHYEGMIGVYLRIAVNGELIFN